MSIICRKNDIGWIIDHEEIVKNIYNSVVVEQSLGDILCKSFTFNRNLFAISTPFLCRPSLVAEHFSNGKLRRKRKHNESLLLLPEVNIKEEKIIKTALRDLKSLCDEITDHLMNKPSFEDVEKNNEMARKFAATYFEEICKESTGEFSGGNHSERPILVKIKNNNYLIPNNSKFFCIDISRLITSITEDHKYDFILMDPPWWNKYVRRRKKKQESSGYKMMYNEEVGALPVARWLAPGALAAVWCTNCGRHIDDVVSRWFPAWGLRLVATWYWLKVTRNGQPVCQFSPPPGKQPYERILFGSVDGRTVPQPPDGQCIVSVPSAIHSHKPPLVDVIKEYLPQDPKCLELFARYLLPNWTSAGDQVLSLQNIKLYTEQPILTDC